MHKPINTFPGYHYISAADSDDGKPHNMYRGVDVGFGGYVYAEPGMYTNVALLDVANMHGASIVALNLLGEYTQRYSDLRVVRNSIKHGDFETPKTLFEGKLIPYLQDKTQAESLSAALKLPLNQLYGITSASFENPARDSRNVNNIVALRGALFMKTLQDEIVSRGFDVVHCKTDSCKVPNATPEIIEFIKEFGRKYDYEFEHEATYDRMCLVNDAVYIAKYDDQGIRNKGGKKAGKWTATGTQFQIPYVFKKLFSKEPIEFSDMCETKSVTSALYLDMNEDNPEEHNYIFIGKVGQFCPIKPGCGGGILVREKDGKYNAATGSKGYRWLESELVKNLHKEDDIDISYYNRLVDEAVASISEFGDFEWFTRD